MDLLALFRNTLAENHCEIPQRKRRYSSEARELAVHYCREQHSSGLTYMEIAGRLGISLKTLYRWLEKDKAQRPMPCAPFHPVALTSSPLSPPSVPLRVTLPNGFQVDGLDFSQVIELARSLS